MNLADLKAETNELIFDVVLPEGVVNYSGVLQVTATVSFPELGSKKLTVGKDQFVAAGVQENASVVWISEVVEIELRGPRDVIKNLTEKDITVTVDFTGEAMGNVSKIPQITVGAPYTGVGAISVGSVAATVQLEDGHAAAG